jgi:hypothetical protein
MSNLDDWFNVANDADAERLKERLQILKDASNKERTFANSFEEEAFIDSYAADLRAVADKDKQEMLDFYGEIADYTFRLNDLQTAELRDATANIPIELNDDTLFASAKEELSLNLTDEQKDTILIKDAVIRQIFVNSGMLYELKKIYNCDIYFGNKDGRYALIIKPNNTNYIINATNGFGGPLLEDRIFFNLSKKDITKQKIPTEYMSQYIVKDNMIHHVYKSDGKPTVLKHNEIVRNKTITVYNAYMAFNDLLKKEKITLEYLISQLLPEEQLDIETKGIDKVNITRFLSRDQILSIISKLYIKSPDLKKNEIMTKIIDTFNNKEEHDKLLKKAMDTNNRVFYRGHKIDRIEEVNRIPMIRKLFDTNNNFTETLAYRYARYYPNFEFTKSSIKKFNRKTNDYFKQEYSNPLKFKLQSTFTITDVYLHKFDRHINDEYAMNRFNIKTVSNIKRLYKLMELAKSIMFTFISLSLQIKNIFEIDQFITVNIYNIYPGLIWNTQKEIIIHAVFKIYKKDNIIHINIHNTEDTYNELNLIPCLEVPFLGIEPPVSKTKTTVEKDYRVIRYRPIIDPKITIMLKKISPEGFEKYLIDDILNGDNIRSINKQFFDVGNDNYYEEIEEESNEIVDYVEKPEYFPELQHTSTVAPYDDEVIKQEELRRQEAYRRKEASRIEEERLKAEEASLRRNEARRRDEEARNRQRSTVAIPAASTSTALTRVPPPGAGGVRINEKQQKAERDAIRLGIEAQVKKATSDEYEAAIKANPTDAPIGKKKLGVLKEAALEKAKSEIRRLVPASFPKYIHETSIRIVDEIIKENASKMKYLKYKNKYIQLKHLLNTK